MNSDEIIINLLARLTFGENKIRKIITKNKRNSVSWIKGYNACNGERGVSEIAKIVGVAQPTATVMLKLWGEEGLIYNIGSKNKPRYKKLMKLHIKNDK